DFKNSVIIMSSNVGAEIIVTGQSLGFGLDQGSPDGSNRDWKRMKGVILDSVKKIFRPEFLNRIDDIVVFKPLDKPELLRITEVMLRDVVRRAADQDVELSIKEEACELLLAKGFDPKYGARPLRRAIQRMVEDKLADMILEGALSSGDHVSLATSPINPGLGTAGDESLELRFEKEPHMA
ncbi:MAG: AAA family ATPase, partial [Synergistaceae bacterium]|nr:AAA family ATPase [Synergistaceae bacterium]